MLRCLREGLNQGSLSLKSIDEALSTFQKKMWSSNKPIEVCLEFIEALLLEQMRIHTVMRESKKTISSLISGEAQDKNRLEYLMKDLSGSSPAVFLEHFTEAQRQEYNQYLKKQVTFDNIQD